MARCEDCGSGNCRPVSGRAEEEVVWCVVAGGSVRSAEACRLGKRRERRVTFGGGRRLRRSVR